MIIQGILRFTTAAWGVPIFLMLTGYLNCTKRVSLSYFPKLLRVLVSYVLISVITWAVLVFADGQNYNLYGFIWEITHFQLIGYSWYIDMYIWLFFLIPLLNIIIDHGCNDRENRLAWLILAGILFLVPSVGYSLKHFEVHLMTDYWSLGWLLNFYIIGALFSRYCPSEPPAWFVRYRWYILAVCVMLSLLNPVLSILRHKEYIDDYMGLQQGCAVIFISVALFLCLYSVKACPMSKAVSCVSRCSLDMYLFSYIIDIHFYPQLRRLCPDQQWLLLYYIPSVAFLVFAAWLVSYIKERLFRWGRVPKILG